MRIYEELDANTVRKTHTREENNMVWPAVISAGSTILGGVISGSESSKQRKRDEKEQQLNREVNQLGQWASGPREETLPYLNQNLQAVSNLFGERDQYYGTAGETAGLNKAINEGLYGEQVGRGTIDDYQQRAQNALVSGEYTISGDDVASGANALLNSSLINSQVDAYGRDIGRVLGEQTIPGIRSADVATGNLGSSRGGVQEAIARRGAEDRIADFRGGLVGQALQQSQSLAAGNRDTNLGLMDRQFDVGQVQMQSDRDRIQDYANLGSLQQQIEQNRLDNLTGARDFNLQNQLEFGDYLTGQANIGNLTPKPKRFQ